MSRVAAFLTAAFLTVASPPAGAAAGAHVRILLQWLPQAQFAGYYVAEADGLYRAAGLDVELSHASASQDFLAELFAGHCDYTSGWLAAALLNAKAGTEFISVAQFYQGSALAIVARRSAGINRLEDLNGRKIVVWLTPSSRLPLCHMLDSHHVRPSALLPMLSEPDLFLGGAADAMSCVTYNEYTKLIMAGFEPEELALFRVSDIFPKFVDDGLFTLRRTYARDPSVARRIREATMEGWRRAFANPDHALALIEQQMYRANLPYPKVRQRAMLDDIKSMIDRPENDGRLRRSTFDFMCTTLELPSGTIDFSRFAPQEEEPE